MIIIYISLFFPVEYYNQKAKKTSTEIQTYQNSHKTTQNSRKTEQSFRETEQFEQGMAHEGNRF